MEETELGEGKSTYDVESLRKVVIGGVLMLTLGTLLMISGSGRVETPELIRGGQPSYTEQEIGENVVECQWLRLKLSEEEAEVLSEQGVVLEPIFNITGQLRKRVSKLTIKDLESFYRVHISDRQTRHRFFRQLQKEGFDVTQESNPAPISDRTNLSDRVSLLVPDLSMLQESQNVWSNHGMGIIDRDSIPGISGSGTRAIIVGYGMYFDHSEFGGVNWIGGAPGYLWGESGGVSNYYHDTAAASVIVGREDEIGINGLAPDAEFGYIGFKNDGQVNTANAILNAISFLGEGDVLLVELQAYAPDEIRNAGLGLYAPITLMDDVRIAVRAASEAGIIVVIPAGNGGHDLHHPAYMDVFKDDPTYLLVNASFAYGRGRADFSNFLGTSGDCRMFCLTGLGDRVVTAGYSDIYNMPGVNDDYGFFNGTSSASSVVAAIVTSLQGSSIHELGRPLSLEEIYERLSLYGAEQHIVNGSNVETIGNMPHMSAFAGGEVYPDVSGIAGGVIDSSVENPEYRSHKVRLDLFLQGHINFIDLKIGGENVAAEEISMSIVRSNGTDRISSKRSEMLADGWVRLHFDEKFFNNEWTYTLLYLGGTKQVIGTYQWYKHLWVSEIHDYDPTYQEWIPLMRVGREFDENEVVLNWQEATYLNGENVSPEEGYLVVQLSTNSDLSDPYGTYFVPIQDTSITFDGLPMGVHYWSVSTVITGSDNIIQTPIEKVGIIEVGPKQVIYLPMVYHN